MKVILFSLIASLALVSPAMGKAIEKTASFDSIVDKVEALTAASNAVVVANQVRIEMAKGSNKKIELIKF